MKNTFMTLIGIAPVFLLFSCNEKDTHTNVDADPSAVQEVGTPNGQTIIGVWGYTDERKKLTITFFEENKVAMQVNEASATGIYGLNTSTDPWQLDITWNESIEFKTIIDFLDNNRFQMEENNPGDDRPSGFTAKAFTLERTK